MVAQDIRALIGDDLGRSNDDWQNTAERLGRNLQDIGASLTAASRGADRTRPARLIGWIADSLGDAIG